MKVKRYFQNILRHPLLHTEHNALDAIAASYHSDRATHSTVPCRVIQYAYTLHYERYFSSMRQQDVRLLELGVAGGAGVKMWRDYFPRAQIYAADIDPSAARFAQDRIEIYVGDLQSPSFRDEIIERSGGNFDIIIDDASHSQPTLQDCFEAFFPTMKEWGFYVVEDTQTSYSPAFGSGYQRPGSMLEFLKSLVDSPNWEYYKRHPHLSLVHLAWSRLWRLLHGESEVTVHNPPLDEPINFYDQNVYGVHFYKDITFVIKGPTEGKEVSVDVGFDIPRDFSTYSSWLPDIGE